MEQISDVSSTAPKFLARSREGNYERRPILPNVHDFLQEFTLLLPNPVQNASFYTKYYFYRNTHIRRRFDVVLPSLQVLVLVQLIKYKFSICMCIYLLLTNGIVNFWTLLAACPFEFEFPFWNCNLNILKLKNGVFSNHNHLSELKLYAEHFLTSTSFFVSLEIIVNAIIL